MIATCIDNMYASCPSTMSFVHALLLQLALAVVHLVVNHYFKGYYICFDMSQHCCLQRCIVKPPPSPNFCGHSMIHSIEG